VCACVGVGATFAYLVTECARMCDRGCVVWVCASLCCVCCVVELWFVRFLLFFRCVQLCFALCL